MRWPRESFRPYQAWPGLEPEAWNVLNDLGIHHLPDHTSWRRYVGGWQRPPPPNDLREVYEALYNESRHIRCHGPVTPTTDGTLEQTTASMLVSFGDQDFDLFWTHLQNELYYSSGGGYRLDGASITAETDTSLMTIRSLLPIGSSYGRTDSIARILSSDRAANVVAIKGDQILPFFALCRGRGPKIHGSPDTDLDPPDSNTRLTLGYRCTNLERAIYNSRTSGGRSNGRTHIYANRWYLFVVEAPKGGYKTWDLSIPGGKADSWVEYHQRQEWRPAKEGRYEPLFATAIREWREEVNVEFPLSLCDEMSVVVYPNEFAYVVDVGLYRSALSVWDLEPPF